MCKLFNRKKSKSVEYIPNEIRLCTNNGVLRITVRDNASLSLTYVSEPAREKLGYRFVNENPKELMHILGCAIATIKQYFGTDPRGSLEELQILIDLNLMGKGDIIVTTIGGAQANLTAVQAFANAKYNAEPELVVPLPYTGDKPNVVAL